MLLTGKMSVPKPIFIVSALLIGLFLGVSPGLAQEPPLDRPFPPFVPGEILVKFRSDVGLSGAESTLQTEGFYPLEVLPYSEVMRIQVTPGREAEAIATLLARPDVKFAELNHIITVAGSPNDANFSLQWSLHNIGQTGGIPDADIDAPEAWDIHPGLSDIIIAIADSGVDLDHEDLQVRIWLNSDEIPANGIDDDQNGYIDDRSGWDFCNSAQNSSAFRCKSSEDNDPDDENDHGSHVAGIAAATGNNGKGIAGVSWGTRMMPVKVVDAFGKGTVSSLAKGINYAVANGAKVINISLGALGTSYPCPGFETIREAMQNALNNDVLTVVASGNGSAAFVSCPAALDEAFAVGATTRFDLRLPLSNGGSRLDIAAPGENIYSTLIGGYGYKNGTSMATAHVAGLAGLLWSFSPGQSRANVRAIIEATADDLGPAGHDVEYGHGRINARQALEALVSLQTSPNRVDFLVDDSHTSVPALSHVQLMSADSQPITWQAAISPTVSWLSLSPSSGTVSTASSPLLVTLVATRPLAYGTYHTTVVINGTNASGLKLGSRSTEVYLNYVPTLDRHYLPIILKSQSGRKE